VPNRPGAAEGEASPVRHLPQKRAVGRLSQPQWGHRTTSAVRHLPQKRAPTRLICPHLGQEEATIPSFAEQNRIAHLAEAEDGAIFQGVLAFDAPFQLGISTVADESAVETAEVLDDPAVIESFELRVLA